MISTFLTYGLVLVSMVSRFRMHVFFYSNTYFLSAMGVFFNCNPGFHIPIMFSWIPTLGSHSCL